MKPTETQTTIDRFLKSIPETVQETICGGNRPASGGGDIVIFVVEDGYISETNTTVLMSPVRSNTR